MLTVGTTRGTKGFLLWFLEFEKTGIPAWRNSSSGKSKRSKVSCTIAIYLIILSGKKGPNIPISPATLLSSAEKTRSRLRSSKCFALHSRTTIPADFDGIGDVCFHVTTSLYGFPADRADAPSAINSNWGLSARSRINRCPTEPVAPRTAAMGGQHCLQYV